jgi:asparagine synthase (glutamine-hydrolysing)
MCGIVVVHDQAGPDSSLGERMLDRIGHRGPDGRGRRRVGHTWLGHVRLSIVDLGEGDQPLASGDGHWAVVNGEIYNHAELRETHLRDPRSDSDSEAALSAVLSDDAEAMAQLRGMYAFAVAGEDGELVIARDPLGVKPLYWAHVDGAVVLASELQAFDPEHRPLVEEFPPGHRWSPAGGLRRFRSLPDGDGPTLTRRDEAMDLLRERLVVAVRHRMMADVPIGVFLSGGLDSSLVAAIMARHRDRTHGPVHSFAAGTAGSSDLLAARRAADHLGLEHHERIYDADEVVAVLPAVVRSIESYEPSLVRSAVPNYLLAETAATTVKVVLTGEGADELFAGYDHYRHLREADLRAELLRGVAGLHNLNLQRCDRVTMAHGLEARVPFLDRDLVDLAARLPVDWLLPGEHGQEKTILREAFTGWLPEDLLWRPKEQFGDGSGTAAVMDRRVDDLVPPGSGWREERVAGLPPPRSREELAYQRMFAERLEGVAADVLGRFATA